MKKTAAIVLAAGKGTRINAKKRNKVAFKLGKKPMIQHTVENLEKSGVNQIIAVVGFQSDSVRNALGDKVDYAVQKQALGTGDAVKTALPHLAEGIRTVFLVNGDDSAFYTPKLYQKAYQKLQDESADVVLLTIIKNDPMGLGRIIRDADGCITKIVEEKVATQEEKQIKEINTNMYCLKRDFLEKAIPQIEKNPVSEEYYLTDIVEIANKNNQTVIPMVLKDPNLWHGVNTRKQLKKAREKYKKVKQK